MKNGTELFPPNGGDEPVIAHPTQVENMKRAGWTEKAPVKKSKSTKEVKANG